ncbi:MAG: transposase [Coleofasciculus sp. G1-WW12-02]|uniref:transposase n=1 Tax=Coleofasciculus sp. G1-WW12-02 TaxID=3068483 RepID=UPI0032F9DE45
MPYEPQRHHRHSIRLKGYDYRQPGAYFVTLCIRNRDCLLGEIIQGNMYLSPLGRIVKNEWYRTAVVRPNVELDAFVIMPNHLHGIIVLTDTHRTSLRTELSVYSLDWVQPIVSTGSTREKRQIKGVVSGSLGAIIGQFKSLSAKRINRIRQTPHVPLWQRDFYDHIIHRETSLHAIRKYIVENPLRWIDDPENPEYPVSNQDPLTDFPF